MATTDLYLLGCGIRGTLQLTTETIQALKSCHTVYLLHDDLVVHETLKTFCGNVHDLAEVYSGHSERRVVYQQISELVVAAAEKKPRVAFASHGHPLFLVSASEYMLTSATQKGLRVRCLPAISSLDTVMCDLGIDLGYGVQIFDATTLLKEKHKLNTGIPALVFNLATCLNDKVVYEEPEQTVLSPLVNFLSRFYPESHPCTLVLSGSHVLESVSKLRVRLSDLNETSGIELWKRPSLYIPPIH